MRVDIVHNIRWSRYKARVFSALHTLAVEQGHEVRFVQIADTEGDRTSLSGVELAYHRYPHELLFEGSYESVSTALRTRRLFHLVWFSSAELVLIPSYSRLEHWAMLLAGLLKRRRLMVVSDSTLEDRPQTLLKGLLKRIFLHFCDGAFCYGERAEAMLLHYGMPARKIHRRCQAAALPDGYSIANALLARIEAGHTSSVKQVLYVGRLSPEKSLHVLVEAFSRLLQRHTDVELVMVGGGSELPALQAQVNHLGLQGHVRFLGGLGQESLARCYASAACLVLPSQTEPWGLVVNEALHYGCPVVVSDRCGCVPELVKEGINGWSFKSGDAKELSDRIGMVLKEFPERGVTAMHCLKSIASYTPEESAAQMMMGFQAVIQHQKLD